MSWWKRIFYKPNYFKLCILYLSSWEVLPTWQNIIIGVIAAIGVQHLVVLDVSKYLMHKHPDFDNEI